MTGPSFSNSEQNPLTELAELRFDIEKSGEDFGLICQLRIGLMSFEHKEREYEVGVSSAHLRLSLEGCQTKLGKNFGESELTPVEEEITVISEVSGEANASAGYSLNTGPTTEANAGARGGPSILTS